jgi:pimeloyl-ACP methyl ester carboxylesterase
LIESAGARRASVGHDIGAGLAWALGMRDPESVERIALLLEPLEHIPAAVDWARHEHDAYRRAFEEPGALHAMINYYSAIFRAGGPISLRRVEAPVLVLWGDRDPYLRRSLARPGRRWARNVRVEPLRDTGHFIQHERPSLVTIG